MLSLKSGLCETELMDDPSTPVGELQQALVELPGINRLLGGYRATESVLRRHHHRGRPTSLRILDFGTGIGDYPRRMVRWGDRHGVDVTVVGIDANETSIRLAKEETAQVLSADQASRISFVVADANRLEVEEDSFDICTAALFLHHLSSDESISLLARMNAAARIGIIVNDLHRCLPAYWGISVFTRLFNYSSMVRHDGPVSVRRAFTRQELAEQATHAGISSYRIEWHWAFRWILTNVPID